MVKRICVSCVVIFVCVLISGSGCTGGKKKDKDTGTGTPASGNFVLGTIVNLENEVAIPGITCTVRQLGNDDIVSTGTSDAGGLYEAGDLANNTDYRLFYSGAGYYDHFAGILEVATGNKTGIDVGMIPASLDNSFFNDVLRANNAETNRWETKIQFYLNDMNAGEGNTVTDLLRAGVPEFTRGNRDVDGLITYGSSPSSLTGYDGGTGTAPGWIIIEYISSASAPSVTCITNGTEITAALVQIPGMTNDGKQLGLILGAFINAGMSDVYADSIFRSSVTNTKFNSYDLLLGHILYGDFHRPGGNRADDKNPADHVQR